MLVNQFYCRQTADAAIIYWNVTDVICPGWPYSQLPYRWEVCVYGNRSVKSEEWQMSGVLYAPVHVENSVNSVKEDLATSDWKHSTERSVDSGMLISLWNNRTRQHLQTVQRTVFNLLWNCDAAETGPRRRAHRFELQRRADNRSSIAAWLPAYNCRTAH